MQADAGRLQAPRAPQTGQDTGLRHAHADDAVCWRDAALDTTPRQTLASLAARARDHYDIYMLIEWLTSRNQIDTTHIHDAIAHMQNSDAEVRKRRNVNRLGTPPPADGYRTLRAWQPDTSVYQHLEAVYPSLQNIVYGHFPPWPDVAQRIRNCRFI